MKSGRIGGSLPALAALMAADPVAAMKIVNAASWAQPPKLVGAPQPKHKLRCLLPGCDVLTDHNGGYCCREHARKHRQ